jgi:uncharacterized protein YxjI
MTEISDEQGFVKYRLTRNPAAFGLKMHLLDSEGSEIALIRQKIVSLSFGFLLIMDDTEFWIQPKQNRINGFFYEMRVTEWRTFGDLYAGEYVILSDEKIIASVRKFPCKEGECCEVELAEDGNTAIILAFIITIEAALTLDGSDAD